MERGYKGSKDRINRTQFLLKFFIKFFCKFLFNLLEFFSRSEIGRVLCGSRRPGAVRVRIAARIAHPGIIQVDAGNWASFVRIAAAGCGLGANCGALSAPWCNPRAFSIVMARLFLVQSAA
jgi:hypothetical protein